MLEVKHLEKQFDGIKAVHDCDFTVEENKIVALIGPNGAGKTTVFNLITGLTKLDRGDIHFKGMPIINLKPYKIAELGITRTFQLIRLFPRLTAIENLLLARSQEGENFISTIFKPFYIKHEEKTNKERVLEFLKLVNLEEKRNSLAQNLSYGQQKLLEIARALATEADFLMLDEQLLVLTL